MTVSSGFEIGFQHKSISSQAVFRAVMSALAQPGTIQRIESGMRGLMPLVPASAAIALTLFDHDTPVWLDAAMARSTQLEQWLRFHTGAPITQDASSCAFALIADPVALPDFEMFSCGSHEYPDRSSTLIIQVASLTEGAPLVLRGPGIAGMAKVSVAAGMPNFLSSLARNHALFPCGVDILLVAEDALIGIPRTTSVIHEGH